jgi:hypothetical protein
METTSDLDLGRLPWPAPVPLDETEDLLAAIEAMRTTMLDSLRAVKRRTSLCTSKLVTRPHPSGPVDDHGWLPHLVLHATLDCDDPSFLRLRVEEVYLAAGVDGIAGSGELVDGDRFVDIKTDRESVALARAAMLRGDIPLHNRDRVIDREAHPYVEGDDR